jgi:hypothetical protein|tara:strand:+ start:5428 stop:5676 length:249 start_codon:yes stop_codon:yes gene_type:complete
MVEMWVLLLFLDGTLKEYAGHQESAKGEWVEMGMSGCLRMRRTLKRNGLADTASGRTRVTCEKRTVELKTNREGKIVVAKVL